MKILVFWVLFLPKDLLQQQASEVVFSLSDFNNFFQELKFKQALEKFHLILLAVVLLEL